MPSPAAAPRELFLSHASADVELAGGIVSALQAAGIEVFFSPAHIPGGREWQRAVGAALDRCDWFAVLLTPNSVESMWVERELQYALLLERYRDRIIPLLAAPCDYSRLSWTLRLLEIIDFTDIERGNRRLLSTWGLRC